MNTYANALLEYGLGDDNGKHKLIYSYFGLAIYFCQCLEETFSIMLWTNRIYSENVKTNKEVNDIIDLFENTKKTMGNFINEVKQNYNLPNALKEELKKVLDKRNYLVHKYFKIEIQKFCTEIGQKEMLQYFTNFIDETKIIDDKLKSYYDVYINKLGITEELIEKEILKMKNEEIKRTNKNNKIIE
jgi:hypothetical protein